MFLNNREYNQDQTGSVLTFPLLNERKEIIPSFWGALLSEVTPYWDTSSPKALANEFDQFLLEESVNKLNQSPIFMKIMEGKSGKLLRPADAREVPFIDYYYSAKAEQLSPYLSTYAGIYQDGEDDAFSITPTELMRTLLSEPDLQSAKDFMQKRRIRRKRTHGIIHKF